MSQLSDFFSVHGEIHSPGTRYDLNAIFSQSYSSPYGWLLFRDDNVRFMLFHHSHQRIPVKHVEDLALVCYLHSRCMCIRIASNYILPFAFGHAMTNSFPNSPEPNNKIFFINSFIYNFIYLRFDDVRCTIRVTLDNKPPQAKAIPIVHRKSSNSKSSYWCCSLNKSFTVFTGLNVVRGTSTNTVFQSLIAPFHKPGSSSAFRSLPFLDL